MNLQQQIRPERLVTTIARECFILQVCGDMSLQTVHELEGLGALAAHEAVDLRLQVALCVCGEGRVAGEDLVANGADLGRDQMLATAMVVETAF